MTTSIPVLKTKDGKKFVYVNYHPYYSEREGKEVFALSTRILHPQTGRDQNVFFGYTDNVPRAVRWSIAMQQLQAILKKEDGEAFQLANAMLDIMDHSIEYRPGKFEILANKFGVKLPESVPYDIYDEPKAEVEEIIQEDEGSDDFYKEPVGPDPDAVEIPEPEHLTADINLKAWGETMKPEIEAQPFVPVKDAETGYPVISVDSDGHAYVILNGNKVDVIGLQDIVRDMHAEKKELKARIETLDREAILLRDQCYSLQTMVETRDERIEKFTDKMLDLL